MKPLFFRLIVSGFIAFSALLLLVYAQRIHENKEREIGHFKKIEQNAHHQQHALQQTKLCAPNHFEKAWLDFQQHHPSLSYVWQKKLTGDFSIWEAQLKMAIPPEIHWATFLKNMAEKLPAQTTFSQCVFHAQNRQIYCLAQFYQRPKC